MSKRLEALQERKAALVAKMKAISDLDDPTDEQNEEFESLDAEITKIEAKIDRENRLADLERSMSGIELITDEVDKAGEDPALHFATFGEQLQAIAGVAINNRRDPRLTWQAAASGANEAIPSEGGFLVQKDFSLELLNEMHEMGDVMSRVNRIGITVGNGIKLPAIDETSRADGSRWGGVRAYWANEADTVTASKPKFRLMELDLKKLFGLGYATEEMLQDAAVLETVMRQAFLEELTFKGEDGVINGTGSGQPLGILNSGGLISVAKESGQAAATVNTTNILNMWSRMPARNRRRAVWLVNQDVEPQLFPLTLGSGTAVILLYTPPGARGNAEALLMGRPVIPVEYCATLGTVGDIILADLGSYIMIDKGGQRAESSMHVRFIYDEMTFRFIYRLDGQPSVSAALTPYKGSNTLSPFVALATRS